MPISRKHVGDRQPGDRQAYREDGCRCYPCSDAWGTYCKQQKSSDWQPFVDAYPIREHLAYLSAHGIGMRQVEKLTGTGRRHLTAVAKGTGGRNARLRPHIAEKILAIQVTIDTVGDGGYIDGTGTHRRLRALVAAGFPDSFLTRRLGAANGRLHLESPRYARVRGSYARAVRDLYDELSLAKPEQFGLRANEISRARNRSRVLGWPRPLEWDDDLIDDPASETQRVDRVEDDDQRTVTPAQLEDLRWILSTVDVDVTTLAGRALVAERMRIKPQRVEYILAKKLVAA